MAVSRDTRGRLTLMQSLAGLVIKAIVDRKCLRACFHNAGAIQSPGTDKQPQMSVDVTQA